MIVLVAVLALAGATLWQADNSGTNALSGDPQAITSAGDAASAVTPFRHAEKALAGTDISH